MAKRFTLEILMDLASQIGANPAKAISRSNISFLGKGPTKNPLFQNRLAGLENATKENLGKPETLFGAIEDAVGWAKDGKLNSIQTEILGHNLSGINKILNPPPLPTASVTAIRPGIEGLRRFPKESHRFFGRPLKDKDFSEIDRMVMEGKIPDARGRQWNLRGQETGPEVFNAALNQKTGMSRAIARELLLQDTRLKLKPEELFMLKSGKGEPLDLMRKYYGKSMMNLDAWLDDFLPRTTLPPRDLASRVLNEVELIPQFAEGGRIGFGSGGNGGVHSLMPELDALTWKSLEGPLSAAEKDRMELLIELTGVLDKFKGSFAEGGLAEILQAPKMKHGGRIGFFKGAQADTKEGKAMSPGTSADYTPGAGHRTGGDGATTPVTDTGQGLNITPIQTFKDQENKYLDKFGAGINRNKAYAAGLLSLEDVMKGDIKPDIYAGYSGDNFNIEGQKTKDMTGLYGNTSIGPVNVKGSYEDFDGNINKHIGATTNLGGVDFGVNYNFEGNPTFGVGYNTPNLDMGVNYNLEGDPTFGLTYKKTFNKGGLARILEV